VLGIYSAEAAAGWGESRRLTAGRLLLLCARPLVLGPVGDRGPERGSSAEHDGERRKGEEDLSLRGNSFPGSVGFTGASMRPGGRVCLEVVTMVVLERGLLGVVRALLSADDAVPISVLLGSCSSAHGGPAVL
jgi:hypothetical protein